MNTKILAITLFFGLALTACKTDSEDGDGTDNTHSIESSDASSSPIKPKEYEEEVEVVFQYNSKNTSVENKLLQAINFCDIAQTDLKNYMKPACDAKFFKVLPTVSSATIEENFLVVTRSGVFGYPVRRTIVFTKEGESYVAANTFIADLVAMEKNANSTHKDLILQFMDPDENRFECRYVWKEGRYSYDKVMKINGNKIKAEYLDSMKVEIGREISRLRLSH